MRRRKGRRKVKSDKTKLQQDLNDSLIQMDTFIDQRNERSPEKLQHEACHDDRVESIPKKIAREKSRGVKKLKRKCNDSLTNIKNKVKIDEIINLESEDLFHRKSMVERTQETLTPCSTLNIKLDESENETSEIAIINALENSSDPGNPKLRRSSRKLITDSKKIIPINPDKSLIKFLKRYKHLCSYKTTEGYDYVECPACSAVFLKKNIFEKHMNSHVHTIKNNSYICRYCRYNSTCMNLMFKHLKTHNDQCEVCHLRLTRNQEFKRHWDLMDTTFSSKLHIHDWYKCKICNLYFDLDYQLHKHWFNHTCKFSMFHQCQSCEACFSSKDELSVHRCLTCPVCNKLFDCIARLKGHTKSEKHYLSCSICLWEFILRVDYEKHMNLHKLTFKPSNEDTFCLTSEDNKYFQCSVCNAIFNGLNCLIDHFKKTHVIREEIEDIQQQQTTDMVQSIKTEFDCNIEIENILKTEIIGEVVVSDCWI